MKLNNRVQGCNTINQIADNYFEPLKINLRIKFLLKTNMSHSHKIF